MWEKKLLLLFASAFSPQHSKRLLRDTLREVHVTNHSLFNNINLLTLAVGISFFQDKESVV